MILLPEALDDLSLENDLIGLLQGEVAFDFNATLEVELDDGNPILRLDELIKDIFSPLNLILSNSLLILHDIPCTVYYHHVFSLKAWACFHWEFHELRLDLFGYLPIV